MPTSHLSLHGLVRHMAEVERGWFRRTLLDEPDAPVPVVRRQRSRTVSWCRWTRPTGTADLAAWQAECDASRRAALGRSLDDTGPRDGKPCSLRWIYHHMIEEYARHNGHADLIREMVDGAVGW